MTGVERIAGAFRRARHEERLAFVPHLVTGDPDLDGTRRLTGTVTAAGADVLELGVPWARLAVDGPVMPRSSPPATGSAVDLDAVLTSLPVIRGGPESPPVVLLADLDPVVSLGEEIFAERAAAAGVDGVLLSGPPGGQLDRARSVVRDRGLAAVFLVTPGIEDDRLRAIARTGAGFVHVASTEFLGDDGRARSEFLDLVARVRDRTRLPVAVGFGLSSARQLSGLRGAADAFVAGNALEAIVERQGASDEALERVATLARKLVAAARSE
jgi:tryptophan synthase alpha chain